MCLHVDFLQHRSNFCQQLFLTISSYNPPHGLKAIKNKCRIISVNTDWCRTKCFRCLIVLPWRMAGYVISMLGYCTILSFLVSCMPRCSRIPACCCPPRREDLGWNSLANWSFRSSRHSTTMTQNFGQQNIHHVWGKSHGLLCITVTNLSTFLQFLARVWVEFKAPPDTI